MKVNLILISDHGMAAVPRKNSIVLDEMFDASLARHIFWVGELVQIFPKEGKEDEIYDSIKSKLPSTAKIYRKAEIPARFRYRDNRRIAPILVLPDEGWVLTTRERFEKMKAENDLEGVAALMVTITNLFRCVLLLSVTVKLLRKAILPSRFKISRFII